MARALRTLVIAALVAGAVACGSATSDNESRPHVVAVVAQPKGAHGPLVGYADSGAVQFRLPDGIASADRRRFVAAGTTSSRTALTRYDARSGRELVRRTLAGRWDLRTVSADGRTAVLTARRTPGATRLAIVSVTGPPHMIRLEGRFDVDAVSNDGQSLFLIERRGPERYAVRLYALDIDELAEDDVRPKNDDEEMVGLAGSQVGTPDGTWLLTLYVNTRAHEAFVHALNLRERFALCLDLPGTGALAGLRAYGLALARDGSSVYAVSPRLGALAKVGLRNLGSVATSSFPAAAVDARALTVSLDGRTLYVAGGRTLWRYDLDAKRITGSTRLADEPTSLSFDTSGRRLYAVGEAGFAVLDPAT